MLKIDWMIWKTWRYTLHKIVKQNFKTHCLHYLFQASLEKTYEELTNSKTHSGDKLKALEDNLTNLENDLNGNKQKIEDANGIIKRQTEQLLEQATDLQDFKVHLHSTCLQGECFPKKSYLQKFFISV